MKLSACHKAQGDDVEWWSPEGRYDLVYKSRVFTDTYSKDRITVTNWYRYRLYPGRLVMARPSRKITTGSTWRSRVTSLLRLYSP